MEKTPSELGDERLLELLTYKNPHLLEYKKLLERIKSLKQNSGFGSEFAPSLLQQLSRDAEANAFLMNKLMQRVLVDIGGGYQSRMYEFADYSEANLYINVDTEKRWDSPRGIDGLNPFVPVINTVPKSFKHIPQKTEFMIVRDDALDFLAHLPAGSANIVINGIDHNLIDSEEYHRILAKEIARVVGDSGVVFGVASQALEKNYLSDEGMELASLECCQRYSNADGILVYIKKQSDHNNVKDIQSTTIDRTSTIFDS